MPDEVVSHHFSDEWWRITLASIGDAVMATDSDGQLVFLNSVAEHLTGWSQREAQGRPLNEVFVIINESTRTKVDDPVAKVLNSGHVVGLGNHTVLINRAGREIPIDDSAAPIHGDKGELLGVVLIFRDITERRQSELAKAYLAAIVASSTDAVIGKTLDGIIRSWNQGAEAIFGYTRDEAVGRPITIIIPPERYGEEQEIISKLKRAQRIDHFETVRVRKDGSRVLISLTVSPIKSDTGEVIGASKIARDITEKKRTEEEIVAVHELLRLITDNMAVAVTRCSRDLRYVWVSKPYAKWLQRPPEEIEGRLIADVIGDEGFNAIRPHIERALSGQKDEYEALVTYQGPGRRWIHAVYVPTIGENGLIDGWVAVVTDITERRQTEQERDRLLESERIARAKAEEANRLKDEFVATISHELRTPLTSILGWTALLRTGALEQAKTALALETVERNARTQAQLIEDLLDVSRIITGKLRLNFRPVMLAPVVESALASVKPMAEAKGVRLQPVLDPSAAPVSGDSGRLQQVIWNLLSNAIKFTPTGGRVQVRLARINSHFELTVADTGQGIDPAFLPHVFDRFRQADSTTTRHHGGLGLGLTIVRQLVELHGGTVSAYSQGEGRGATFTVRLPLMTAHPQQREVERLYPAVDGRNTLDDRHPDLKGVKVLIVDDDADTRVLLRTILEGCGAEVRDASSAEQGLREAKEWRPAEL